MPGHDLNRNRTGGKQNMQMTFCRVFSVGIRGIRNPGHISGGNQVSESSNSSAVSEVLSALLSSSVSSSEVRLELEVEDDDCEPVFFAAFEGLS